MTTKGHEKTRFDKILRTLIILCFVFIGGFIIWGNSVSPDLGLFSETASVYDEEWLREYEDGHSETFVMPTSLEMEDDQVVNIKTVLPMSIKDCYFLAISMGKSYTAYVDGQEIYAFDNTVSRIPFSYIP